jgi:uncharacterized protein DUF5681
MPDNASDYQLGPGRPPLHTRFKKGRSGNPGGRSAKTLPALLAAALDETVSVTTNGRRRKFTKREAIVTRMVDTSASADLRATKMADRHDAGGREEGRRRSTPSRTAPAGRGGRGGGAAARGAATPAGTAGNRRGKDGRPA